MFLSPCMSSCLQVGQVAGAGDAVQLTPGAMGRIRKGRLSCLSPGSEACAVWLCQNTLLRVSHSLILSTRGNAYALATLEGAQVDLQACTLLAGMQSGEALGQEETPGRQLGEHAMLSALMNAASSGMVLRGTPKLAGTGTGA